MARRTKDPETIACYNWEDNDIEPEIYKVHKVSKALAHKKPANWTIGVPAEYRAKGEFMTMNECRKFIAKVCNDYGVRTPEVVTLSRSARTAHGSPYQIALTAWGRNKYVCLHELAHAFCSRLGYLGAGHGPIFKRVMIELLARYTPLTKTYMLQTAKKRGLEVASAQSCNELGKMLVNAKAAKKAKIT